MRPLPYTRRSGRKQWKFLEPNGLYILTAYFPTTTYPDSYPCLWLAIHVWDPVKGKYTVGAHLRQLMECRVGQEDIVLAAWTTLVQEWPDPIKRQEILDSYKVLSVL